MPVTGCIPFTEVTDFILFCSVMAKKMFQDWKLATEILLCFTVLNRFNKWPEICDTLFISLTV